MRTPFLAGAAIIAAIVSSASGQTPLASVLVADGLESPLFVTHAPKDFARVFITERDGRIRIVKNGVLMATPYLDIAPFVNSKNFELGLLGLAFDPAYAASGLFFVHVTGPEPAHDNVILRFRVSANPDIALASSAATVLRIPRIPGKDCHNGGWLGFGPDGYLYTSIGDGQCGCDPEGNAQSLNTLLGKMLRLNVSTLPYTIPPTNPFAAGGGRPEIWAYGLRNPWRPSFDRATGDLWIADVGESSWEEINVQPAPGPGVQTARNYGWRCREGMACSSVSSACVATGCPAGCWSTLYTNPIHTYPHNPACSITGGYVYRGCAIPDLQGAYFFSDFCAGRIWSLRYQNGQVTGLTDHTADLAPVGGQAINVVVSFGEDAYGELYFCDFADGQVFKMIPEQPVGPDCNANGVRDACDILSGASPDANGNGIPDECECYANCNGSAQGGVPTLSIADFTCFQTRFVLGQAYADCNQSGTLSTADFGCFQTRFVQGCP